MDSDTSVILGLGFVLLSTVCNGTFALPPKFVRNWAWENTWGTFFFLTLVVLPAVVVVGSVNGVFATWRAVDPLYLAATIGFGFLWGCGIVGFGIGVTAVGLSLGFSIIISLSALLGSMVPLVTQHPEEVMTPRGLVIMLGILICIGGIAACGWAGVLRERAGSAQGDHLPRPSGGLAKGLLVCVLAGVCSSGSNIAFSYGQVMKEVSQAQYRNPPWLATMAVWMLVFLGAFAACGSYAVWLLFRNATWRNFANRDAGRNLLLAATMAVLHFATLFSYGVGAHYLGKLGTSVGYASMMSCSLLVANLMGFMTNEWKGTGRQTHGWLYRGLALLILGIITLTIGNNLHQ
jgi:L-rhamnose-H+ transport protein